MSETTFTPGPWSYAIRCNHDMQVAFVGVTIGNIHIDIGFENDTRSVANASLISAAPDLYESATAALNLLDRSLDSEPSNKDIMTVLEKLSAALAKARGEL